MHRDSNRPRRPASLLKQTHSNGSEHWYGTWYADGQQVTRLLGQVRANNAPSGLTPQQAEAALRRTLAKEGAQHSQQVALDIAAAGGRHLEHKRSLGLKKSTLMDYESTLRVHLVPSFGELALEDIDVTLVEEFVYQKQSEGKAPKSILNYLGLLHSIFTHGVKREWCTRNPVILVKKPRVPRHPDIRFLTLEELEAVLMATPDTALGRNDRLISWRPQ